MNSFHPLCTQVKGKKKKETKPVEVAKNVQDVQQTADQAVRMRAALEKATLGWARMNTADPPRKNVSLRFGFKNPRPVSMQAVDNLRKSFKQGGGRDPSVEPLNVLVKPKWINPSTVADTQAVAYDKLPLIEFTQAASDQTIDILSGQHRTVAARQERQEMLAEVERLKTSLQKLLDKSGGGELATESQIEVDRLKANIANLSDVIQGYCIWAVRCINAGPSHCVTLSVSC